MTVEKMTAVEAKLYNIRIALEAKPPQVEHALNLARAAYELAKQDSEELWRLNKENQQYSELTKALLSENAALKTQLEDAQQYGDICEKKFQRLLEDFDKQLAITNELRARISKFEAQLEDVG